MAAAATGKEAGMTELSDGRLKGLSKWISEVSTRMWQDFIRLDKRIDWVERRLEERMDRKFAHVDERIDRLQSKR
jgi:hypothetical protein